MCGICGGLGITDNSMNMMLSSMHLRGPDDFGFHRENEISIGMTRLAIIDPSSVGHQPMSISNGKIWIVFNGEVYNFREERRILEAKGRVFKSHTDTEVIVHMYEEYGDKFLSMLRGMFALAILDLRDPKRKRLLLARDVFGIKPLLYYKNNGKFLFGSEIKTLLSSQVVPRNINFLALNTLFVRGSISQPSTMIEGVLMLPPGHFIEVINGNVTAPKKFWSFQRNLAISSLSLKEQHELVKTTLETSVERQLVSDVPIGAFLSGGIDSSLLVAMMARKLSNPVKTFSVGFGSDFKHLDETEDSLRISKLLKTDHYRLEVSGLDVRNSLEHIIRGLDQPTVDGVNSYFVSKAASSHVKVAISGTGGDELFAGYPWFYSVFNRDKTRPFSWRQQLKSLMKRDSDWTSKRAYSLFTNYHINNFEQNSELLNGDSFSRYSIEKVNEEIKKIILSSDEAEEFDDLEAVSVMCLRGYTQNQLLRDIDGASMSQSLEVRVPYLDNDLLTVALSISSKLKWDKLNHVHNLYESNFKETGAKKILFDIGKEYNLVGLDAQKKRGFSLPMSNWLLKDLRDVYEDSLSLNSIKNRGFFSERAVLGIKNDFESGRSGWPTPWLMVMTELWAREFLD